MRFFKRLTTQSNDYSKLHKRERWPPQFVQLHTGAKEKWRRAVRMLDDRVDQGLTFLAAALVGANMTALCLSTSCIGQASPLRGDSLANGCLRSFAWKDFGGDQLKSCLITWPSRTKVIGRPVSV